MSKTPTYIAEAIILCGGLGTRLREKVSSKPKALAEINGVPFLDLQLRQLFHQGISKVVLATGYLSEQIQDFVADCQLPLEIALSVEDSPLGTGGALALAAKQTDSEQLLVLNGDTYCTFDLTELTASHENKQADITMLVTKKSANGCGTVVLDENDQIISFTEKQSQSSALVNCGIYLLNRKVLNQIRQGDKISLEHEIFPGLVKRAMFAHISQNSFIDIGTPETYDEAQSVLNKLTGNAKVYG